MIPTILTVLVALLLVGVVAVQILNKLVEIAGPNEVLVFSGSGAQGYQIVKAGRRIRWPLFERVDRLDLTNMNIEVEVKNAFSAGGIPLTISGIANVKIAGESPALDNAIQRLLGKPRSVVKRIAKETLEGYLRGVLATLTPEEANENTQAFERELRKQAGEGFERLGLTLDNLKVQSISDDVGYLQAVGRIAGARLNRDNRVAEAERRSYSLQKQAEARRLGELAKIDANWQIAEAGCLRRVANAQTAQEAYVAEQEGEVAALITRARAELELQDARIEQAKHQLEAEVVRPAKADMEAKIAAARGQAAPILEQGKAQAQALNDLAQQWHQAGESARDIFVLQKLQTVLPTFLDSISGIQIDQLHMLQANDGSSLPNQAVQTLKALEAGGLDVPGLLAKLTGGGESLPASLVAPSRTNGGARAPSAPRRAVASLQAPEEPSVSARRRLPQERQRG
ncbi:MAG: SPFH domain-containing protein [Planctomycetota bacterium]